MKVRIVQLLCPQRHCIVASAYESADGKPVAAITEHLKVTFAAFVKTGANPWCGICQSRELTYEDSDTGYTNSAEAMPAIMELARQQAVTREVHRALKANRN